MPRYKIMIEYDRSDGTTTQRLRMKSLLVEAESFAKAMTHEQVAKVINQLSEKMVDKQINSLPPEVAAEAVASSLPLYSVQICAEVCED